MGVVEEHQRDVAAASFRVTAEAFDDDFTVLCTVDENVRLFLMA